MAASDMRKHMDCFWTIAALRIPSLGWLACGYYFILHFIVTAHFESFLDRDSGILDSSSVIVRMGELVLSNSEQVS